MAQRSMTEPPDSAGFAAPKSCQRFFSSSTWTESGFEPSRQKAAQRPCESSEIPRSERYCEHLTLPLTSLQE